MAARAAGGGEAGELSEALQAEIEEAIGREEIFFSGNGSYFGNAGAVFLAEKLRGNTTVKVLGLRNCGIGAVGARALVEVLGEDNTMLRRLDFPGNQLFGNNGAEAIAPMLRKRTKLDFLNLCLCGMGDRGARALGEALKDNFTLKILYLNSNDFGDDAARALAEALRWNESLERLSLGNCRLTNTGASSLLAALRESNSTLTVLSVSEKSSGSIATNYGIEDSKITDSIQELLDENKAAPATAERRARCLLFCCLQLAPTAHEHAVPSIGAVPVPVMQYAVEHAGKLHVAKRFEHGNAVAGHSSAGVRARSSPSLSSSDSLDDLEPATARRR